MEGTGKPSIERTTKAVRVVSPIRKDSRTSPWMKRFELINIKIHERAVVVELWWVMGW
jgi:hypothetical protein